MRSLGLIEVESVTAALDALDIMCKSAAVEFVTWERKLGGRLVTIVVRGEVSAVAAAVESAVHSCIKTPRAHAVIANPHEETERILAVSAARMSLKTAEKKPDDPSAEIFLQEV